MDRAVLFVGSVLGVGALLVAAVLTRPRPASMRDVVYLVMPLLGAVVLVAYAWSHT